MCSQRRSERLFNGRPFQDLMYFPASVLVGLPVNIVQSLRRITGLDCDLLGD